MKVSWAIIFYYFIISEIFILCIFNPASPQATQLRFFKRKDSKDAPLLRDLIKDTLPLIEEEEKKPRRQVDSNSRPLDYEVVAPTTNAPVWRF